MSTPASTELSHQGVSLNFNVLIDASSNITVFGSAPEPTPTNIIESQVGLPVNALYDPSNNVGLIELWEPSAEPDNIKAQLANIDSSGNGGLDLTGKYKESAKRLARGFERALCGAFNCINAPPFNANKYNPNNTPITEYTTQRDFGRVTLGALSHYLFGHVDATSAITNDVQFIQSMLSLNDNANSKTAVTTEYNWNVSENFAGQLENEGTRLRFAQWTKSGLLDPSGNTNDYSNWGTGSATDADLARRLVKAILEKGIDNNNSITVDNDIASSATASLGNIVKQVVGQDSTRLMNQDNSERTKDIHQLLRFYAGDVIYVNIKLKKPTVTIGTGGRDISGNLTASYDTDNEINYTLKMTLTATDTSINTQ
jgi:hypothetical protein